MGKAPPPEWALRFRFRGGDYGVRLSIWLAFPPIVAHSRFRAQVKLAGRKGWREKEEPKPPAFVKDHTNALPCPLIISSAYYLPSRKAARQARSTKRGVPIPPKLDKCHTLTAAPHGHFPARPTPKTATPPPPHATQTTDTQDSPACKSP